MIYALVDEFFNRGHSVEFVPLAHAGIIQHDRNRKKWVIKINVYLSDDEKVITFIHELLHFDPKYPLLCTGLHKGRSSWVEKEIEYRTIYIFNNHRHLVQYLKRQLGLSPTNE